MSLEEFSNITYLSLIKHSESSPASTSPKGKEGGYDAKLIPSRECSYMCVDFIAGITSF